MIARRTKEGWVRIVDIPSPKPWHARANPGLSRTKRKAMYWDERRKVKRQCMGKFKTTYEILSTFPLSEVLPFNTTVSGLSSKSYVVNGKSYDVKMTSQRYRLFHENNRCVICGLEGVVMRLEYTRKSDPKRPHFNMYGFRDGIYILMNKDHIIPASKGGLDLHENYQTMCEPCNSKKGANIHEFKGHAQADLIRGANQTS